MTVLAAGIGSPETAEGFTSAHGVEGSGTTEAFSDNDTQKISDIVSDGKFTTLGNPLSGERYIKRGNTKYVTLVPPGTSQWDAIKVKNSIVEMM
jgi:hypothetical protein